MERREMILGGVAVAAGALAAGACAAQSQTSEFGDQQQNDARAGGRGPSVFDFGAAGDGTTDDGPAIQAALQWACDNMRIVELPSYDYAIRSPIAVRSNRNVTRRWGLIGGGTLVSSMEGSAPVLTIDADHYVRYLVLEGFGIRGNGRGTGHGLLLRASGNLYGNLLSRLTVESMGGHGIYILGAVFESGLVNCMTLDNRQSGLVVSHMGSRHASSILCTNLQSHQNRRFGLLVTTDQENKWQAAYDVRLVGGYMRDNGSYAAVYHNGLAPGAGIYGTGFENNCNSNYGWNQRDDAHCLIRTRVVMRDVTGHDFEHGNCKYLVKGTWVDDCLLDNCVKSSYGPARDKGYDKLAQISSGSKGTLHLRMCKGDVEGTGMEIRRT